MGVEMGVAARGLLFASCSFGFPGFLPFFSARISFGRPRGVGGVEDVPSCRLEKCL